MFVAGVKDTLSRKSKRNTKKPSKTATPAKKSKKKQKVAYFNTSKTTIDTQKIDKRYANCTQKTEKQK